MRSTLTSLARRALRRQSGDESMLPAIGRRWTYEAAILRILRENEGIGLERVVDLAADEAMRRESAAGAWAADVGIWGPSLFRREAVAALSRMFGTSLILEGDEQGSWSVAPVTSR